MAGRLGGPLDLHAERTIGFHHDVAWLAVVAGNHRARRFYERGGWVDRGAFDSRAEISAGTMLVPARRYEKSVRYPAAH